MSRLRGALLAIVALALPGTALTAQDRPLPFSDVPIPPLAWTPPEPEIHTLSNGVEVFYLHDPTLPLVSGFARFSAGPSNFPRERLAAATAVSQLVGSSGTLRLPPDSLDRAMAFFAAETSFGGGGRSSFSSVNTLRRHLEPVLSLWFETLLEPGFDPERVEEWRTRRLESVRRREDNPGSLAVSEFNRLMYGDHPTGWEITAADLTEEALSRTVLREMHGRIYCRGNLTLGVTGDLPWPEARRMLEARAGSWPVCIDEIAEPPTAHFERAPGIYLIRKELPQSTIVVGQPSEVRLGATPEYFASRIGNLILGGGGFTSRLVSSVRTEMGLAYSVSSVWTTPERSQGIIGALGQTGAESTVAALRAVQEVFREMAAAPPRPAEVSDAIDRIRNGYVFNFQNGGQIVSRLMALREQGLPLDWLGRYVEGIGSVTPEGVHDALSRSLDLEDWVILVVGNPDRFGEALESLGPVTEWTPVGN